MSSIILNPFQLLELNIISAQDLAVVTRNMKVYAVVWVHPDRKLSTRVDSHGRNNPTWNDKFVFRVDDEFLQSDTSGVMIEIYAVHWFKDVLVGRVRVLVGNLVTAPSRFRHQNHIGMRFVALQVRRPSGRPQGLLNIGVALLDSSMRSMPLYMLSNTSAVGYRDLMGEEDKQHHHNNNHNHALPSQPQALAPPPPPQQQKEQQVPAGPVAKPELRRTKSDTSSIMQGITAGAKTLKRKVSFRQRPNSVINASEVGSSYQDKKKGNSRASSMVGGVELRKKKQSNSRAGSIVNGSEIRSPQTGESKMVRGGSDIGVYPKFELVSRPSYAKHIAMDFEAPTKAGKIFITESELGPSPSEVAAAVALKEKNRIRDAESSVADGWSASESMEGLQSKLERWRMELPTVYDRGEYSSLPSNSNNTRSTGRHGRRHTDGGGPGLFSCVSNICGCECSIVCGK